MNDPTRSRGDAEITGAEYAELAAELNGLYENEIGRMHRRFLEYCATPAPPRLRVKPFLKWTGTALQLGGCLVLALHVPLSPYAYGAMSAGAGIWLALSLAARDWPQAALMAGFEITNVIGIWRWVIG